MLQTALHHPRKLWIRKALFQVHLWAGLLLTLYLIIIALTGSVLVFESELTGLALPSGIAHTLPATPVAPQIVIANVERLYPGATIDELTLPYRDVPAYQLTVKLPDHHARNLVADATNGAIAEAPRTWVQWVHDLHVYLLLDPSYGAQVNASGATALMLLTFSGLALWWNGVRNWARGLRVNLRANWRRINYDMHSAIGFWTLFIVFWWALSGMYFGFYKYMTPALNAVFPLRNMKSPTALPAGTAATRVPLSTVLHAAQNASPHAHLFSLSNAALHDSTAYASMDLAAPGNFLHRDIVLIDTTNGHVLSTWHYAEKHSVGDWILWLQHPLHFGTQWGLAVKVLWFLLGLTLAALAVTGVLMYWNRYLRHLPATRLARK